jgi:hypothetical protein
MLTNRFARVVPAIVGLVALAAAAGMAQQQPSSAKPTLTVYKSPTCGCCSMWAEHMRRAGFDVKQINVDDLDAVKRTYGVPPALGSCHTGLVNGYVVEGHVPADAVLRMLKEKPQIVGIAVPGMPIGSPGMEQGSRRDPYSIMSFDKAGKTAVYDKR